MSDLLLVDAGNTRIKWCKANSLGVFGDIKSRSTVECLSPAGCSELVLEIQQFALQHRLSQVLLCDVLGQEWSGQFVSLVTQSGLSIQVPEQGRSTLLSTRYVSPVQLGKDRWLGCLAVASQSSTPLNLVVSLGTATTIDAVVASSLSAQVPNTPWLHLGGVILPGVDTMFESLNKKTQQLPFADISHSDWPTQTLDAIGSGVVMAQFSTVKESLNRLQMFAPGESVSLWVSGGYAQSVLSLSGLTCTHLPSLVFAGLVAAAGEP